MKLSYYLPTGLGHEFTGFTDPLVAFDTIAALAVAADESGYHTLWAADHFLPFPPAPDYMFEVWTTLSALARDTSRIRLGQMVTANGYRNPALQAKMASILDVICNGRFSFGIGAGWYEADYTAYGYDFPDGPERLRQLGEALQIITLAVDGTDHDLPRPPLPHLVRAPTGSSPIRPWRVDRPASIRSSAIRPSTLGGGEQLVGRHRQLA